MDLCFGGCGNSVGADMSGFTEELIVVDGQIYPGTEIGMTPAVSGLSSSLNKDIRSKSNQVTDIYDALQRVMQYEQVGSISLYESVQRELERQELIAFLQYLTNSKFLFIRGVIVFFLTYLISHIALAANTISFQSASLSDFEKMGIPSETAQQVISFRDDRTKPLYNLESLRAISIPESSLQVAS